MSPAWNKPYTHLIKGIYDVQTMLESLQKVGFNIRREDYEFMPNAKPGSKHPGTGGLYVTFQKRDHANAVREAINLLDIADGPSHVYCQRAGNDKQKSAPETRPELENVPTISDIRNTVREAYALKRAQKDQLIAQDLSTYQDTRAEPQAETEEVEGIQDEDKEDNRNLASSDDDEENFEPRFRTGKKGKRTLIPYRVGCHKFTKWIRQHWDDGQDSAFHNVKALMQASIDNFMEGKSTHGHRRAMNFSPPGFKDIDGSTDFPCIMNPAKDARQVTINLPPDTGLGVVQAKGTLLPIVAIPMVVAMFIVNGDRRIITHSIFGGSE